MKVLLLTAVLAASPAAFPKLSALPLPQRFDALPAGQKLSAGQATSLVFEPASKAKSPNLQALARAWNAELQPTTKERLAAGERGDTSQPDGAVVVTARGEVAFSPTVRLVVVSVNDQTQMGESTALWVLSLREGTLVDGVVVNESTDGEAGASHLTGTLTKDGKLSLRREATVNLVDLQGLSELALVATGGGTLDASGRFTVQPMKPERLSGRYTDEKTEEAMTVIDTNAGLRVFYQSKKQPNGVELKVEKAATADAFTVQFPKAKAKYPVSIDAMRAVLTSTNPDNTKQRFTRTW